ncbi:hypothetical protein [Steroidobacter sp.]|uniref:hypothetical protein n=1 Tax=Steroidobacter sp. TaxID=1978227 RepID=UPI001A3AE66C|nr:hypothetical protein [Steroidobacter sp.]MBL8267834.1 hypothetical protein [Steroidobacter sp.]
MKIRNKRIWSVALAGGMLGLAACGGGSKGTQDVGNSPSSTGSTSRAFYARAVDGYLAGATVYVDQNENGKLDAFEPRALTDSDGYFSYNHSTNTDYCASGGLSQFCLRGAIAANTEVLIRVTGGYDTVTQLPFKGVLSLRSSQLGRDDLRLVTPVTSLVADSSSGVDAKVQALIAAGLLPSGGSLNDDLLNADMASQMSRAQLSAIISRVVGEIGYRSLGQSVFDDVHGQAWAAAYIAQAAKLIEGANAGGSFESVLSSYDDLKDIARRSIYLALNPGQTVPSSYVLPNESGFEPLLEFTAGLVSLNEQILAAQQAVFTQSDLQAILRLQAVAAERALANPYDPELDDLADWVRNQLAQGNGLGSDFSALGGDDIDLSTLIAANFDFDPNSNSISASATIPALAAQTFAALVNTSFGVSVNEWDEQGAAVFFVSGTNGARSGDIDVCVRYRGNDGDFDTTSSTDPNGALLVGGRWSLLDDHTLTLSIDVAGGVRSLLLRSVGASGLDRNYRFDFGKDLSEWSGSAPAAFTTGSVPATDAACKAALIERFGSMT